MIQVGDIFKHMRLPEFDERNHQHMHLVELVREAHNENDADVRNNLLTQISDIGNSIIETWTPTEYSSEKFVGGNTMATENQIAPTI